MALRRSRPSLMGMALLCVLFSSPFATASETSSPPLLGRSTRLRSAAPVRTEVFLPKNVKIRNPLLKGNDVSISGSGQVQLFVVVRETGDQATYVGGRLRGFAEDRTFFFQVGHVPTDQQTESLKRGLYSIYLIPGGAPMSVRLRLDELSGTGTTEALRYESASVEVRRPTASRSSNLYAAGADGMLQGDGLLLGLAWFSPSVHGATVVDFCQSKGRTPEDWAYMPGQDECDSSSGPGGGETWVDANAGTSSNLYYATWQPSDSGIRSPGASWYQHSVTVETLSTPVDVETAFVWITY